MTVNRDKLAAEWRNQGYTCDLWVDPPGQVWANFIHSTDELLMVLEGELELEMPGHTFKPAIGEEVLIPAGTNHTVRNVGKATSRWLYGYKTR
ncbi:MAG: cupin domain-containing protein [Candidatus Bathyarchaeia archaeon]